jgi:hypothetical protein
LNPDNEIGRAENEHLSKEVRFDDSTMWVELADGRSVDVPLARFPRLLLATPEQRAACDIGHYGLYSEAIDEDISIERLLAGRGDMTRRARLAG